MYQFMKTYHLFIHIFSFSEGVFRSMRCLAKRRKAGDSLKFEEFGENDLNIRKIMIKWKQNTEVKA